MMDASTILALVAVAGLILQEIRHRRTAPRDEAKDEVALQRDVTQAFREGNTLHIEDAKTLREQASTITALTNANVNLLAKIDGMPTLIAEQAARLLSREGYILTQAAALASEGKEQPPRPEEPPLTELVPPTLLADLEAGKDILRAGDDVKLVDKDGEDVTMPIHTGDPLTIVKDEPPSETSDKG